MNAETLLENFDVLVEATDGIDNLRTLLIDLGIRGLLTGFNEFGDNGFPISWKVQKFKDYCDIEGGNQPPKSLFTTAPKDGFIRLFQIRDLGSNPVPVYIPTKSAKSLSTTGDILIGRYGASVGKVFYAQDGAYNVALVKFVFPKNELISEFVYWVLRSSRSQAIFSGMSRSAQAGFNKRDLAVLDIPTPGIDEQKLIVTKINDLMALCDQLEQQQKHRNNLRTATRKSAIDAISTATTPEELETAWKRINNNWDVIADTPESIDHLRSLVINLGVQGQLFSPQEIGTDGYPISWKTRKFGGYCDIEGGSQPPKDYFINELKPDYVRLFQIRDLGTNPVPVFIPRTMAKSFSVVGDILIGRYGASVGKIFRAQDGAYNVALVKFVFPKDDLMADFVFWMLQSSRIQAIFSGMSRSAQAGFNKRDLAGLDIPIPEMKEQKQIVAKIDELMALCDQLEARLKVRSEVAEKFARSVVNAA